LVSWLTMFGMGRIVMPRARASNHEHCALVPPAQLSLIQTSSSLA
jgi:hypothetical protein